MRFTTKSQVQAFQHYLSTANEIDGQPNDPEDSDRWELLAVEDLNNDWKLDFIATVSGGRRCGTGGCQVFVFVTEDIGFYKIVGDGSYRIVGDLFGHSMPTVQVETTGGFKDVVATYYSINTRPVWARYRWNGSKYDLHEYSFCLITVPGACNKAYFEPVQSDKYTVDRDNGVFLSLPLKGAEEMTEVPREVIGKLKGADWLVPKEIMDDDWYLVSMITWDHAAFVEGKYVASKPDH